jgi:serine O-acetyltransferase
VIPPETYIRDRVTISHQVTNGRAAGHVPSAASPMEHIEIGDDVIVYPGRRRSADRESLVSLSMIAANAVLTRCTGVRGSLGGHSGAKVAERSREATGSAIPKGEIGLPRHPRSLAG